MMHKKTSIVWCVLLLLAGTWTWAAQAAPHLPARKKLIEYGWDVPTPAYVAAHLTEMEKHPFDGVIMRLSGKQKGNIFQGGKWNETDYAADVNALEQIKWGTFTDNFLMMYAASDMDWFSDRDWEDIVNHVEIMAQAAKAGKCGLAFDPEPYGRNPWQYSKQLRARTRSFAEYQAKVRQRGAQFIRAIQKQLPETVLLTLFSYSIFPDIVEQSAREKMLAQHIYGLYPAFLTGIMDAMGPGITLIDGNEPSYYYTGPEPYYTAYHRMRQSALRLVSPENAAKFLLQTQAGQALYFDHVFGTRRSNNIPAQFMTAQERLQWWEHNIYWALKKSDEYVWLYSERMNWWKNKGLPPGMEQAVVAARAKIAQSKPLGFDLHPLMSRIQKKQREAKHAKH